MSESERGKIVSEKSWIQITDSVSPFPLSLPFAFADEDSSVLCSPHEREGDTQGEREAVNRDSSMEGERESTLKGKTTTAAAAAAGTAMLISGS